jgi:hypothetical protein
MSTTRFSRQAIVLTLSFGLAGGVSSTARAQHTPDPYNIVGEYNRQYEPYYFAAEPNGDGVFSNQNRLSDRSAFRNPNRYQSYLDETQGLDSFSSSRLGRPSSIGLPYYQAARASDPTGARTYRPNEKADKTFYADQQERDRKYFEALGQSDPVKRAQMLREFRAEDGRSGRGVNGSRTKTSRETVRDRLSDESNVFDMSDEASDSESRRPTAGSSARRSSAAPPPLNSRSRSGSLLEPDPPSRRTNATGSSARSSSISGSRTSPGRSSSKPSDVLERSRAFDRESRVAQPIDPRTLNSPPPR